MEAYDSQRPQSRMNSVTVQQAGAEKGVRPERNLHENEIGREVIDAAVRVHRELGPGLLEVVYEAVLAWELERRGLRIERQVPVSATGLCGLRKGSGQT